MLDSFHRDCNNIFKKLKEAIEMNSLKGICHYSQLVKGKSGLCRAAKLHYAAYYLQLGSTLAVIETDSLVKVRYCFIIEALIELIQAI
jgi:hypothetical protein